jgi:SHS2 domain-containing protein
VAPGAGAAETEALLALPRKGLFIAYCDEPGQAASAAVARRVRELGIGDGSALAGGFQAWKAEGYPTEVTPPLTSPARKDERQASHVVEEVYEGVRLSLRAPSLLALFAEAPAGLADALGVAEPALEPTDHLFQLQAKDPEALLLVWLNDLLARTAEEGRLFVDVDIEVLSDRELRGRLRGAEVAELRLEPRPGTLPEVRLERLGDGYEAVITLPR